MNLSTARIAWVFCLSVFAATITFAQNKTDNKLERWKVVSFPDFLNFDVPEPWPQWDSSLNWFLNHVSDENPEFVLVAGDLVNGHWTDSPECIEHMGAIYYESWKRRLNNHNLNYYVAVGDHELGDDPWPAEKAQLVPEFEKAFVKHMNMPLNGPENKKGLAYFVRHNNALFITLETFEYENGEIHVTVGDEQLQWLKNVLKEHRDATFIIVQGHVPVFGAPKARSSSMLMIEDSTSSKLWQIMKEANADIYLCGEFHATTITEKDRIWQIVHGSSWGREIVDTQDYLVMTFTDDSLLLELKSFKMDAKGDYMWNLNKDKGPREVMEISETVRNNGPTIIGTLTIHKTKVVKWYSNLSGCFN